MKIALFSDIHSNLPALGIEAIVVEMESIQDEFINQILNN